MATFGPGDVWRDSLENSANCCSLNIFYHACARENNDARSPQSVEWLAQCTAGKNMAETKRLQRVHEDDVEISRDTPMLKRVIQENKLSSKFLNGEARSGHAIGILQMGNARQPLLK